ALDVSGVAADAAAYGRALALLKAPPEGVKLTGAEVTPPVASPFVFSAARSGDTAKLSGGATSPAEKTALGKLAAKLFPGAKIDNGLALESGASGGQPQAAQWALGALAKLASGKVEVSDAAIRLSGKTSAVGDIEDVAQFAAQAPAGFSIDSAGIAPPAVAEYAFAAMRDDDGLHFTGYTPDAAAHKAMLAAGQAMGLPIDDDTHLAAGLPKGVDFNALVKFALAEL